MTQYHCTTHLVATAHLVIFTFPLMVADGQAYDTVRAVAVPELCELMGWDASLCQTVGPMLPPHLGSQVQKFIIHSTAVTSLGLDFKLARLFPLIIYYFFLDIMVIDFILIYLCCYWKLVKIISGSR